MTQYAELCCLSVAQAKYQHLLYWRKSVLLILLNIKKTTLISLTYTFPYTHAQKPTVTVLVRVSITKYKNQH